jgi:hypothetical protein
MVVASEYAVPESDSTARPKRSTLRKVLKISGYSFALLVVVIYIANVAWKMSGSNQWQLEVEKNGVQIYSLKAPGSYNKQFRGVMRADFTLNQLVAGLIENATLDNCKNFIPGCVDMKVLQPWSERTMSDTVLWKLALPAPFSPRETVLRSQVSQDPRTKAVTVHIIAAPNATPRNPDAVRLTHIQNRWTYTPVENGQVEIEFLQDMDMGGMFPDFLLNLAGAEETYVFLHDQLPGLLDREQLRSVKYDFIAEAQS